jgi:hypothetical protein
MLIHEADFDCRPNPFSIVGTKRELVEYFKKSLRFIFLILEFREKG